MPLELIYIYIYIYFNSVKKHMDLCLSLTTQLILDEIKKKDNHSKNVVIFPLSTNIMLASGYKGEMWSSLVLGYIYLNGLKYKLSNIVGVRFCSSTNGCATRFSVELKPKNRLVE